MSLAFPFSGFMWNQHCHKSRTDIRSSALRDPSSLEHASSGLTHPFNDVSRLPSVESVIRLLENPRKEKNAFHATVAYLEICSIGLETHEAIGDRLVRALLDCGNIHLASRVFHVVDSRNVQTWTLITQGYIEYGYFQYAFHLYRMMREAYIMPSRYTFLLLLKACVNLKSISKGYEVHLYIIEEGFDMDSFIGNALIDMYGKCGSLADALEVFAVLPARDVVSWNALMTGYVTNKLYADVLTCWKQMLSDGVLPNAITSICSLKACTSTGDSATGQSIHAYAIKEGFETQVSVASSLVEMYSKLDFLAEAQDVFDELVVTDVVICTSLIVGYLSKGHSKDAKERLEQMHEEGISPDSVMLLNMIKFCGNVESINLGREIHSCIVKKGFEKDVMVGNTLIDMYARYGSIAESEEIFDRLSARDAVSWNILVTAYADHGMVEVALNCLKQMYLDGVPPDVVTFMSGLKACSSAAAINQGKYFHMCIVFLGFDTAPLIGNALVDMYSKCAALFDARYVFDKLPIQDIISWNTLIAGYVAHQNGHDALKCLDSMELEKVALDAISYSCLLKACSLVQSLNKGKKLHAEIVEEGYDIDPIVSLALLGMYCSFGLLEEAHDIFSECAVRDVYWWNTLINGYIDHGFLKDALCCIEKMQTEKVSPDATTFACMLKVHECQGVLEMVLTTHADAVKDEFETDSFVANLLIGAYSKAGLLSEAQYIFDELLLKDIVSWNLLISGYAEQGFIEEALKLAEFMYSQSIPTSPITYICILKGCDNMEWIHKLHLKIIQEELEADPFIGTTLMDLYAGKGALLEAQEVFDNIQFRDRVAWNILLSAYAEHDFGEKVFDIMGKSCQDGFSSDVTTLICALKACSKMGVIEKGREIFMEVMKKGFESHLLVLNKVIDMYVKCGSLVEAVELFNNLHDRDVVSFNTMIYGYIYYNIFEDALRCYEHMLSAELLPDCFTLVSVLQACANVGDVVRGQEVLSWMVKQSLEIDFIGSSAVEFYAKCGLWEEASVMSSMISVPNIAATNALIAGFVEIGNNDEALNVLKNMQEKGATGNSVSYIYGLKACAIDRDFERGKELHSETVKKGFEVNSFVSSCAIDLYAKCGFVEDLQGIFDKLPGHDVVTWTAVIASYIENGLADVAISSLELMHGEGIAPDLTTYFFILKACCITNDFQKGRSIHCEVCMKGYDSDPHVVKGILCMYVQCGAITSAEAVFDNLQLHDVILWNVLIAGYIDKGYIEVALDCLIKMQSQSICPNVASWNMLISCHADSGNSFILLLKMLEQGMLPDNASFLSLLKECGYLGQIEMGRKIHVLCHQSLDSLVESSLIDMYGKCGSMTDACHIFDAMGTKDVVAWTALIMGYARIGDIDLSFNLFEEMKRAGIEPDMPSYLSILSVCNHSGLIDMGQKYFEEMITLYGVPSSLKHQNSMADLLGRAGQLDEAMMLLQHMHVKPDIATCITLLGASQKQGNIGHAIQAFEHAMKFDKKGVSVFVLMRNMYLDVDTGSNYYVNETVL